MAITINGSGTVTGITAGGLPDAIITQPELATGVAGTGPAFSAYQSSAQALTSNVTTKVIFQTEEFDTASCFNNTASTVGSIPAYAFLPNVAGYYQVNGSTRANTANTSGQTFIYKNGSNFKAGVFILTYGAQLTVNALIYLNGSTDYLEIYVNFSVGQNLSPQLQETYFQAAMVRSA